jgi:dihydrofolate reductase
MDPDMDFAAMFKEFDVFLMGRKTYELTQKGGPGMGKAKVFVFSNTLKQAEGATLSNDPKAVVAALKAEPGKDIWLFGGGDLFRSMLALDLVDRVEVGVIPVLLGAGLPLLPPTQARRKLSLAAHKLYPNTGVMMLSYDVQR